MKLIKDKIMEDFNSRIQEIENGYKFTDCMGNERYYLYGEQLVEKIKI
jgi:hypothetical protein